MLGEQLITRTFRGSIQTGADPLMRVLTAPAFGPIGNIAGLRGKEESDAVAILEDKGIVLNRAGPSLMQQAYAGLEIQIDIATGGIGAVCNQAFGFGEQPAPEYESEPVSPRKIRVASSAVVGISWQLPSQAVPDNVPGRSAENCRTRHCAG